MNVLRLVPNVLLDNDIYLSAVEYDGYMLAGVPVEMRTKEICMTAVQRHGCVLSYVPLELRTVEMCREALKHGGGYDYIPLEILDQVLEGLVVQRLIV
jgi:hypothetical protein